MTSNIIEQEYDNLNALKNSFMFQLSLASKELFHSNFLYALWLSDKDNFFEILKLLGLEIPVSKGPYIAKREYNNYDFCIAKENNPDKGIKNDDIILVLENKVKSAPLKSQLDRYSKKFTSTKPIFVLLTLTEEFQQKEEIKKTWKIITYRELIEALRKVRWNGETLKYVLDYCTFMQAFSAEMNSRVFNPDGEYKSYINSNRYKALRIHDIYEKIGMSQILEYVCEDLKKDGYNIDWSLEGKTKYIFKQNNLKDKEIFVNSDYTSTGGGGLLELKIPFDNNTILVIQVQGLSYRHCIEYNADFKAEFKDTFMWFFDTGSTEYIDGKDDENFNQFKKNKKWIYFPKREVEWVNFKKFGDKFLYQELIIPDKLTIKDLSEIISRDIELILKNRQEQL